MAGGMVRIKRFGVLSVGKILGVLYAILGLIVGAMFSAIGLLAVVSSSSQGAGIVGLLFGVGAIIFFPILYGIMGFIFGLVMAFFYNLIASRIGGIEVEAE
jgi:hypothetical protein